MKQYIAKTLFGLEEVCAKELANLGASNVQVLNRAISLECDDETLYKIHLYSALSLRIIQPFYTFSAQNEDDLYRKCYEFDWSKFMSVDDTFKIDSIVHSSVFKHSKYAALRVKDAICDFFRKQDNKRPNVDVRKPNFIFSLNIRENDIQLAIDASGDSLFKRGYKLEGGQAPLNEVLAAGVIALSEWDGKMPFFDGMTGSGTLVIEALFKATNKPVGIDRADFGFMNWPNFDEKLWKKVYADANKAILNEYPNVKGIEIDHKTFQIAKENMVRAGFMPIHHLEQGDFFKYKPKENQGVVVLNPPYDERIKSDDIIQLYKEIGNHLKQNFEGWTAWIISGNVEARKHIGLKTSQKIKLFNGKIETRLLKFELY
ncbi:MAG: THUMP domain-containing protein [Chitinophagales bacterium]|nr:hypothetical protein [Bacteroidota bacterium]MCB9226628.1 hypothetical protein [Chitinophagales bacterium]